MKERLPTNYNKIDDLEYIDSEDLLQIELNAKILELDECYDILFIDSAELSEREVDICKAVHTRGRKMGLTQAAGHLFGQMKQRNGAGAALDYLKQYSGTFSIESAPSSAGSGFNFNVIMPSEDVE